MSSHEGDELLVTAEVAVMLRVEDSTLRGWRAAGKRPHSFPLNGRVVYWRSEVEAFIADSEAAAADRRAS